MLCYWHWKGKKLSPPLSADHSQIIPSQDLISINPNSSKQGCGNCPPWCDCVTSRRQSLWYLHRPQVLRRALELEEVHLCHGRDLLPPEGQALDRRLPGVREQQGARPCLIRALWSFSCPLLPRVVLICREFPRANLGLRPASRLGFMKS